ncbi:hypothetical protein PIB30_043911 [Stylosanthes scabra]|uniref:Uncharacterized protein n=1 Tax=Stylosanthes scabra TaxID=79078 RepID=A0ABU6UHS3_9FABA|nr:hypothetical protein [Stylosanthes scabra]
MSKQSTEQQINSNKLKGYQEEMAGRCWQRREERRRRGGGSEWWWFRGGGRRCFLVVVVAHNKGRRGDGLWLGCVDDGWWFGHDVRERGRRRRRRGGGSKVEGGGEVVIRSCGWGGCSRRWFYRIGDVEGVGVRRFG